MHLVEIWSSLALAATPGASQRINPDSPLAQYCGLSVAQKPTFFCITHEEPPQFDDLKALKAFKMPRKDGSWISGLELLDDGFLKEFDYLCSELERSAGMAADESHGLTLQKRAFDEWLDFFRRDRTFSEEAARGLFGELVFMIDARRRGTPWGEIIAAWKGPFGGNQDFVFSGFRAVEVKTLQPSASEIRISSEHQLDFKGRLHLAVFRLQETATGFLGESIVELVRSIEAQLDSSERTEFRDGLNALGYDQSHKLAIESRYAIGETNIYDVQREGFPRLTASRVPLGVRRIQYRIDVASISDFKVVRFED